MTLFMEHYQTASNFLAGNFGTRWNFEIKMRSHQIIKIHPKYEQNKPNPETEMMLASPLNDS